MKKLFLILIALIVVSGLYAQTSKGSENLPAYIPNTLIIKVKKEHKSACRRNHIHIKPIQDFFAEIGVTEIACLASIFDDHETINKKTSVDPSLIYMIKYSNDVDMQYALSKLRTSGFIEYAEPQRVMKVFYVPSDPKADTNNLVDPWQIEYFKDMNAYQAWDVEKGDTNVTIGIIDTGIWFPHEDIQDNLKYNYLEKNGVNGFDDDGNGVNDDSVGYDFSGAFFGAGGDPDPSLGIDGMGNFYDDHGHKVSGVSSATTDNGVGIAGTGFNCKLVPLKAAPDNISGITHGYVAVANAHRFGCSVINLSWGDTLAPSQAEQDFINIAALNNDIAVVGAAGNWGGFQATYPASYDNVLSVAALRMDNTKAGFSSYHYAVDVATMGRLTPTIGTDSTKHYTGVSGTSLSSPMAAGVVGLVRSRYPWMSGVQAIEQVRITGDIIDTIAGNEPYKEKMGKRVNMYRAVTDTLFPSVRMINHTESGTFGTTIFDDDTITMSMEFVNYLYQTTSLDVTLRPITSGVTMIDSTVNMGAIPMMDSANNVATPFTFYIADGKPANTNIVFRIGYVDGVKYNDYQYFSIRINPNMIDIDTNQITVTVTDLGRIGYVDDFSTNGSGFVYNGNNLLYSGGFMIATDADTTKVSDCVRGNPPGTRDQDFTNYGQLGPVAGVSDMQTFSSFNDTVSNPESSNVLIKQRNYAWQNAPDDKYVIFEYEIENVGGTDIDTLYAGIFADWDILSYTNNRTGWDSTLNLGYVYELSIPSPYAGIQVLTQHDPNYFAMDNANVGGNNINPNAGFEPFEKHQTLSSGIARDVAGISATGADVSHVVGATVVNIPAGSSAIVAFALIGGDNLNDLKNSAKNARLKYISITDTIMPYIVNNTGIDVGKGATEIINGNELSAGDNRVNDNEVIFRIASIPNNGQFELTSFPGISIDSFSQQQINDGDIVYAHDNSNNLVDSVTFTITDGNNELTGEVFYINASLIPPPDVTPPFIINNTGINVIRGFDEIVNTTELSAGDDLASTNQIFFHITQQPLYGQFELTNSPGVAIDSFSQQQIDDGKIIFIHDGSPIMPDSIIFNVLDGSNNQLTGEVFIINVQTVAINEEELNQHIKVYPNPANDQLTIDFDLPTNTSVKVELLNTLGKKVYHSEVNNAFKQSINIPCREFLRGMYILKISTESSHRLEKIILAK